MRNLACLTVAAAVIITVGSCEPGNKPMFGTGKIAKIVEDLGGDSLEARAAAVERLQELGKRGLSEREGVAALTAAAGTFPGLKYEWQNASTELIRAVSQKPRRAYIKVIANTFPDYGPGARAEALNLLARLDDEKAADTYTKLLDRAAADLSSFPRGTLTESPRHAGIVIPAALSCLQYESLQWGSLELLLAYLNTEGLDPEIRSGIGSQVLPIVQRLYEVLSPLQETHGIAWMWEEDYQQPRELAGIALDVLGHVGTAESVAELTRALEYRDPRLKHFAVAGLIRSEVEVPPKEIEVVASSSEMRKWLFRELQEQDLRRLFPEEFANQEALAESEMVDWLTFPSELGRVPDEIELMEVVSDDYIEGAVDYYLFRFRTAPPHGSADQGWLAGVAGPFLRKDSPSVVAYGGTFSSFEPWDAKSPAEHVADIRALLDEWSEEHDSDGKD